MPEGPEVRKFADALDAALTGRAIVSFEARTKEARKWLHENEQRIRGRRVERVVSHGKHLLGYIEGDFFFHSHLMMWGRWQTFGLTSRKRTARKRIGANARASLLRTPLQSCFLRRYSTLVKVILTIRLRFLTRLVPTHCRIVDDSIAKSFCAGCLNTRTKPLEQHSKPAYRCRTRKLFAR